MDFLWSAEVNVPLKRLFHQEKIAGDIVGEKANEYIYSIFYNLAMQHLAIVVS